MRDASRYENIRIQVLYGASDAKAWDWDWVKCDLMPRTVLYLKQLLKVYPVQGKLYVTRTCRSHWTSNGKCASIDSDAQETCGSDYGAVDPADLGPIKYYPSSSSSPGTEVPAGSGGYENTDLIIYVTAKACSSATTLAYAGSCRYDQYDRPTAGFVNFCSAALVNLNLALSLLTLNLLCLTSTLTILRTAWLCCSTLPR